MLVRIVLAVPFVLLAGAFGSFVGKLFGFDPGVLGLGTMIVSAAMIGWDIGKND